jgi:hypothetical protein
VTSLLKWLLMSSLPCLHLASCASLLIKSEKDGLSLHNGTVELPKMFLEWSFSFNTTHPLHQKPSFAERNKADGGGENAGSACTSVSGTRRACRASRCQVSCSTMLLIFVGFCPTLSLR